MNHKLSQRGYILNESKEIEKFSYKEYLDIYGADETTSPLGIAPRLFVKGKSLNTWGVTGNKLQQLETFKTVTEAKNKLYELRESYVENQNWDSPRFFTKKSDLYKDISELTQKEVKVIKRYFKILEAKKENLRLSKIKYDNRPLTSIYDMAIYIDNNKDFIKQKLIELDNLKKIGNKDLWHKEANTLVQKVSNNDFRTLRWKEVFSLIKTKAGI